MNRRRVCGVCKYVKPSDSTVNECVKLMKLQSTIGSPSTIYSTLMSSSEPFRGSNLDSTGGSTSISPQRE